ncbi:alpha-amylase family glycosyl hydrolase [Aquimarina rhabdastrellae]
MKKIALMFLLFCSSFMIAQIQNGTFTITPATFNVDDEITITVSDIDPSIWGVSDIFLWTWYFDSNDNLGGPTTNGDWNNSDDRQRFTNNGDGTYSFVMTPSTHFQTTDIVRIGVLAKAKNGDGDKKTPDHLVDVGVFQINLTAPTEDLSIVDPGNGFTITANSGSNANYVLYANGTAVNTQNNITNYTYTHTINESIRFRLEVTDPTSSTTITEEFAAITTPDPTEAAVPANMKDGLNLDPSDSSTATLVMYAPGKNFVHVIGNFNDNDWTVSNEYLLNKDSSSDRFWITLNNLDDVETDILYQYVVDGELRIADPYSPMILSETNDQFINDTTFPNLPDYPTGKTSTAVTWFNPQTASFDWQVTNFTKPAKEDLVIYEILIRDFDALHSFDAVKNRLDYLQDLGVNAIELMPVSEFDGNESWGYNPSFHMALDKYYGTPTAFKQLIDECHRRGIAVIVDVVFNHASGQHPFYRMWNTDNGGFGGNASADSPFFNEQARHSYNVFNDFNHQSTATQDYVKRVSQYWIEEYNVDGFRWDLTKGFTQNCGGSNQEACTNNYQADRVAVLKQYADNQWEIDPDFYVIFEHLGSGGSFNEETEWSNYRLNEGKGIMFWGNSNHAYNEATMGYHDGGKSNFSAVSYLERGWSTPANISYMESHDEERLMYKNLRFGNASGSYSVKNLSTALDRIELAAAFYFTVPGPKMIWQFGELGYDFSINYCTDGSINDNCRVGNKPIRWDYFNDQDRRDVYDMFGTLIDLKKTERIFKTNDFTIDLSRTNGLKRIHLTDNNATGDEIKYVTILGNFGVTTQNIIPDFQETGTWYDILDNNASFNVSDVRNSISLAPGEFKIYANEARVLSVSEFTNLRSLTVVPNPTQHSFSIQETVEQLKIYTITGQLIQTYKGNFEAGHSFSVQNIPSGLYLVHIQNEKGNAISKLVKR